MAEAGWCTEPFPLHEHRRFSDGPPTSPVRDRRHVAAGCTVGRTVDPVDAARRTSGRLRGLNP